LAGRENFVGKRDTFTFNAFINLEPVQRSHDQSINHLPAIIAWGKKNTENTISTNGSYNQAETVLIVDLETQINQLQSCSNGSLTSS